MFLGKLSEELRSFLPKFEGADRLAETDRKITKYDRDIARLEGRLAIPEVSVERVRDWIAELRALKHEALQERAETDQEKSQLDEVKKVLADFESFFILLDRASQLEVVHRFARRIDLGVTNIVIHWRFSENECEVPRAEVSAEAGKKGDGGRVVEIGANRQSCDPSITLLFKLVLEVVIGVADCLHRRENPRHECSSSCKHSDEAGMVRRDDMRS